MLAQKVMNSIHVTLAVLLTTVTCLAQGQLNFANRVGAGGSILNAPVTLVHSSIEVLVRIGVSSLCLWVPTTP